MGRVCKALIIPRVGSAFVAGACPKIGHQELSHLSMGGVLPRPKDAYFGGNQGLGQRGGRVWRAICPHSDPRFGVESPLTAPCDE